MVWHPCICHITTLHVASRCILSLIYCSYKLFISYQHIHFFMIRMQVSLLSQIIISVLFLPLANFYNCMLYVNHWRTLIKVYYHVFCNFTSLTYIYFLYFFLKITSIFDKIPAELLQQFCTCLNLNYDKHAVFTQFQNIRYILSFVVSYIKKRTCWNCYIKQNQPTAVLSSLLTKKSGF